MTGAERSAAYAAFLGLLCQTSSGISNNACEQWPRGAHNSRAFAYRNARAVDEPQRMRVSSRRRVLDNDDARIRADHGAHAIGDSSWDVRLPTTGKRGGWA